MPSFHLRGVQHVEVEPGGPAASRVRVEGPQWQAVQGTVPFFRVSYCTHINPAPLKEDWSHQEEQQLFALHNQIGNKWAVIGKQLGGK